MSGNKKNNKDEGLGLGTAVLLGAGAAAVGFLARDLWTSYQEYQGQSSSSGGNGPRPPPRPPGSNSDWEHKTDDNLGKRMKQRDVFRDQHVPDEMKCVICLDKPREVCLIPCSHVCMCEDCADKVKDKCPVCQGHIENKKAIYI